VEREAERFAVEALREHDVLHVVAGEVLGDERRRATVQCRLAVDRNDARAVFVGGEVDCGHGDDLRLDERRGCDHACL